MGGEKGPCLSEYNELKKKKADRAGIGMQYLEGRSKGTASDPSFNVMGIVNNKLLKVLSRSQIGGNK